jgi:DNA repair protein RadD
MSGPELRGYQSEVIEKFTAAVASGERKILMVAPTGAGKTVIAAEIIKHIIGDYNHALVIAHRTEIVEQTSRKLHDIGVRHGIIKAGFPPRPFERVQVASIQTLHMRAIRAETMPLPSANILVVDEAHHSCARTYQAVVDAYPDAILLGLTATPCRGDGRGLGGIFTKLIECPQVGPLIEQGHLVKTIVFAPPAPDLKGVKTVAGDYHESQLADRMDRPQLIGDIVTHWHKFGKRRKTVAFAVNVQHSIHLRDEFIKSGVRAEHIDGATPKNEREATLSRLAAGEIEVVSNCMVLTEGWDMPDVGACILARPTKKMGLFRQMIGRVIRPAPGKVDAIVLDHSGAVHRHGFVEDEVCWTLDPDERATSPAHTARCENHQSRLLECTQCAAIRVAGLACANCGFLPQRPPRAVSFIDGDLGEVSRDRREVKQATQQELIIFYAELRRIAEQRGYKPGWAAQQYKTKFGGFPPWSWNQGPTCTPTASPL